MAVDPSNGGVLTEVDMGSSDSSAPTIRATVIQASTIFYDTPATLDKAERLLAEAASFGSQLVVFPEAFVGGYPRGSNFGVCIGNRTLKGKEDFRKYHAAAINVPGPEVDRLAAMAGKYKVYLVMGVIERDGYTLYCTVLFFDNQGCYLGKHRKLMPTALERIIWGFGDGSTVPVFDTPIGKIGAAICWENKMPLLRTAMYAKASVPTNLHSHASSVPLLNGTNFSEWRENVEFTLGVLDLDLALTSEKPPELNDKSTKEDKELHKLWEKSNRLSLMFMRMTISANIKSSLPTKELAKDFMNAVAERFKTADKSVAGNLMAQLTTMKFDGTRSMYDHVTEMQNISTKLNDLGITVTETFLVTFILNSLPEQYAPFQMHYNTHETNWTVDGLRNQLDTEEKRLVRRGITVAHLTTQGAHHKFGKKAGRSQKRAPPIMNNNVQPAQQKVKKDEKCRFCKKPGHFQKDCPKRREWFEKKGIPYNPNHRPN